MFIFGKFWNTLEISIEHNLIQSSWSSHGSFSFLALGPNADHSPKPVKNKRTTSTEIPIERAGSGDDDKVCINFAKIVNNLCITSNTIAK